LGAIRCVACLAIRYAALILAVNQGVNSSCGYFCRLCEKRLGF
jgi:hypothetical protein